MATMTVLNQNDLAVRACEKVRTHHGIEGKHSQDQQQSEHRPDGVKQASDVQAVESGKGCPCADQVACPIAAAIKVCSFQSLAGRMAESVPRHITPMVSHTPSNSGR